MKRGFEKFKVANMSVKLKSHGKHKEGSRVAEEVKKYERLSYLRCREAEIMVPTHLLS